MSLRSSEQDSANAAKILLRQGRSESACRILESTINTKGKEFGINSIEYQNITCENIETLLINVVQFIESNRSDSAIPIIKKLELWTSKRDGSLQINQQAKDEYRGFVCFLSGCLEKNKNNNEVALRWFMEAAQYFELCNFVTELIMSYVGAAHALMALNKDNEALYQLRTAMDLLSSPDVSQNVANPIYEAMSYVYMKQGNFGKAKEFLELAIKARSLTESVQKMIQTKYQKEQDRCNSASSSQSAGAVPKPPSESGGGARFRANIARNKRNHNLSFKNDLNSLPIKELGQLRMSVNRLMSCV